MTEKPIMMAISKLIFKEELYPRTGLDDQHVRQFERAIDAGIVLPPVIVAKGSNIIVDGVHRLNAHSRRGLNKITAIIRVYKNDAELFRDAIALNSGVGLRLGTDDTLKVLEIGERLGLKEIDLATLLRTSISHLRLIKPRYATFEQTTKGVKELRRVGLKGSVRHLAGEVLTKAQVDAMESAPGQSFLLTTRQLISACEHDLLPSRDQHPTLWRDLERLSFLLNQLLRRKAA